MKSERESQEGKATGWTLWAAGAGRPGGDWLILRLDEDEERNNGVLVRGRTLEL